MKTVLGEELERHTSEGWILLDVIRRSTVLQSFVQEYAPMQPANPSLNYYPPSPSVQTLQKNLCVAQPWFLIGKDDASVMAEKERQRISAWEQLNRAEAALREEQKNTALLPKALEAVAKHVREKDAIIEREKEKDAKALLAATTHGQVVYEHQRQMNLVRIAIGERTMRDILEPEIASAREKLAVVLKDEGVLRT